MYRIPAQDFKTCFKLELAVLSVCAEDLDYVRDRNCHPAQEHSASKQPTFNLAQLKQTCAADISNKPTKNLHPSQPNLPINKSKGQHPSQDTKCSP